MLESAPIRQSTFWNLRSKEQIQNTVLLSDREIFCVNVELALTEYETHPYRGASLIQKRTLSRTLGIGRPMPRVLGGS